MKVKMNKAQRTGLALVVAILFVDEMLYSLIIPLVPYFTEQLHISSTMTGILFSSYPIAAILTTPLFGMLADRIGRRKPILIGLVILVISTLLFALGQSVVFLIAARAIQGIASAAAWGASLAYLADLFPARMRGRAMGLAFTGISTGTLLGAPFGGLIFDLGGYEWPFLIAATIAAVNMIFAYLWIPETSKQSEQPAENGSMLTLFQNRSVLFVGSVILAASMTLCLLDPLLPMLLEAQFDASSLLIGLMFGVMTLAYALISPISGSFADRYNGRVIMFLSLGIIIIALPIMAFSTTIWTLLVAMILAGAGIGGALSPTMAALGNAVDASGQGLYGSAYALSNMIFMIGMIFGPLIGGSLADIWSVSLVLIFMAAAVLLFVLVVLGKRQAIKERSSE